MTGEGDPPDETNGSAGVHPEVTSTVPRQVEATLGLTPREVSGSAAELGGRSLAPGEQLAGRFIVVRFIARGGMGAVYEANDAILRTTVALKVLDGRFTADPAAMERFRREVLLARRVAHPAVCHVYEIYQASSAAGVPIHFLTMEFLDGETLAARLARQGRFTTEEARPLVEQMCAGLSAAHAEGVIHRDFKSSNVMLVARTGDPGQPRPGGLRVAITDFGVARALEQGEAPAAAEALTGEAGILGTPEYMAPEQVTGAEVSPATDVYALGVVMYEMVTGRLPFSGGSRLAAAARRIHEPAPRPELAVPGLDPGLEPGHPALPRTASPGAASSGRTTWRWRSSPPAGAAAGCFHWPWVVCWRWRSPSVPASRHRAPLEDSFHPPSHRPRSPCCPSST